MATPPGAIDQPLDEWNVTVSHALRVLGSAYFIESICSDNRPVANTMTALADRNPRGFRPGVSPNKDELAQIIGDLDLKVMKVFRPPSNVRRSGRLGFIRRNLPALRDKRLAYPPDLLRSILGSGRRFHGIEIAQDMYQTLVRAEGFEIDEDEHDALVNELCQFPLPVLHSPPSGWQTLGRMLGKGASGIYLLVQLEHHPVLVIVTGVVVTTVYLVKPSADELRTYMAESLGERLRRGKPGRGTRT
jgi:hypothetical protein